MPLLLPTHRAVAMPRPREGRPIHQEPVPIRPLRLQGGSILRRQSLPRKALPPRRPLLPDQQLRLRRLEAPPLRPRQAQAPRHHEALLLRPPFRRQLGEAEALHGSARRGRPFLPPLEQRP